jgi:hypothetical protein
LKEVQIVNAPNTVDNLFVIGNVTTGNNATTSGGNTTTGINDPLPGIVSANGGSQHGWGGFSDVRLIDASAFKGKLNFTAEVTDRSIAKYINLVDTQGNPSDDQVNFAYTGGSNDDTMVIQINNEVAASRGRLLAGREDFTFKVDGGAGDDNITVSLADALAGNVNGSNGNQNWYQNQDLNNNITILGGDGNDTIRKPGAGDTNIDGGNGNDTIYTDNTGVMAAKTTTTGTAAGVLTAVIPTAVVNNAAGIAAAAPGFTNTYATWTFNTTDQATANDATGARNINDIRSDSSEFYRLYQGKLTVNYRGIGTATPVTVNSTNYTTSDLQYNQAIKAAINNDPVLSKLLVAKDGPANSLIVESLTDGARVAGDLSIAVAAPAVASLSTTDVAAAAAAYGLPVGSTAATVVAAMSGGVLAGSVIGGIQGGGTTTAGSAFVTAPSDYVAAFASDGTQILSGVNSAAATDNLITPGAGNDVVVLSTTVGATTAVSSNETIAYDTAFGNDTIVNFSNGNVSLSGGNGVDHLDFAKLGGTALAAVTVDKSIVVQAFDVTQANALTTIQGFFNANNAAAQTHVYVAVSGNNVGSVYTITDPAGAGNATAVLQGTISLADTPWLSLGAANFVDVATANANAARIAGVAPYFLNEGATGVVVTPVVTTPTATLTSSVPNITETAGGNVVTYTATLTGGTSATALSIPYTVSGAGITTADFGGAALTGNITIPANATSGSVVFTAAADATTEGTETASIALSNTVAGITVNTTPVTTVIADTSTTPVVVPGGATTTNIGNVAPAVLVGTGTTGNDTFNIASGTYAATISSFDQAGVDKIALFANGAVTFQPDNNLADGNKVFTVADAATGSTATITLTGLTAAQDAAIFNPTSFNTVFGAGSIA